MSLIRHMLNRKAVSILCAAKVVPCVWKGPVKLKRTINQPFLNGHLERYWRVMSEGHRNYGSDLSYEGLVRWGIIISQTSLDAAQEAI